LNESLCEHTHNRARGNKGNGGNGTSWDLLQTIIMSSFRHLLVYWTSVLQEGSSLLVPGSTLSTITISRHPCEWLSLFTQGRISQWATVGKCPGPAQSRDRAAKLTKKIDRQFL
jgi:hypothetical protein